MYSIIAQPAGDFVHWGCKNDPPFPLASDKGFSPTHKSWNCGSKFRHFMMRNHAIVRKDGFISFKCKYCLRVGAPFVLEPKRKLLKLSAFKSNSQNDAGSRHTGSKSLKNSVGLSYVPQESEATSAESQKPQGVPKTCPVEPVPSTGSVAIHNLFKSWLMLLRMPSADHAVDGTPQQPSAMETSEIQNSSIQKKERVPILKVIWCYFLGLDAMIKLPLLIFSPLYLAVNLRYGVQVSRELTPLWVLGPLIAALYVKLLQGICALYVFSFKQTVKVITNLPTFYLVAYNYIAHGKLNDGVSRHIFQPLVDIQNLDYKEAFIRKIKDLEVFLVEKYLDFVESIWPYYCRTIRFLKRAHLI
ncbi:hypothetical protein ACH5RR_006845 [Cinchona calisaya]|uniref:Uncharacterized protein n=1 Tax=Cinchona calisaya TaxID=153742 RepID=A0ABD3AQ35_9GENT